MKQLLCFFFLLFPFLIIEAQDGEIIGTTFYDLQTDYSVARRILLEEDGTLHATWTMGFDEEEFEDRGTGYNIRQDGEWGPIPSERLEEVRTGWPNIGKTASGRLFVVSHTTDDGMSFAYKDEGTDEWINNFFEEPGALWPRMGVDGDSIYAIFSRQFTDTFGGVQRGFSFYRSNDGGDTWDFPIEIPLIADYYTSMRWDCYAMDVHNGTIAFLATGYGNSVVLFKSVDNGDNWTATPIALPRTIYEDPLLFNPAEAVDLGESCSMVIDDSGMVHIAYSWLFNYDFNEEDLYYKGDRTGVFYWNESMVEDGPYLIGNTILQDWDGDGLNEIGSIDTWRFYGSTIVDQPCLALDESGNLYITYSTVMDASYVEEEELYYREIFVVKGIVEDENITWEGPLNVSNGPETEDAFASMPRRVFNDELHIIYQSDDSIGVARYDNHNWHNNNIMYTIVDVNDIVTPDYIAENNGPSIDATFGGIYISEGCEFDDELLYGLAAWDYPDGMLTDQIEFTPEIDFFTPSDMDYDLSITDSEGNTAYEYGYQIIILNDDDSPTIDLLCPNGEVGCEEVFVIVQPEGTFDDPGYSVFDESLCPGIEELVEIEGMVDVTTIGEYTVTYIASDFKGNETEVTRTVHVINEEDAYTNIEVVGPDGESIEDGETVIISANDSGNDIPFDFLVATTNIETPELMVDYPNGIPNYAEFGEYEILLTTTNTDGEEITFSFIVSVGDTEAPTLSLIGVSPNIEICVGDEEFTPTTILASFSAQDNFSESSNILVELEDPNLTSFDQPGTYDVNYIGIDEQGNTSEPTTVTFTVNPESDCYATGLEELNVHQLNVQPNPSNGIFTIVMEDLEGKAEIIVLNSKSQIILRKTTQYSVTPMDLSKVSSGIYFVKVKTDKGYSVQEIIID